MQYVLKCPCCESTDLEHKGNIFNCNDCDQETELEDMDFSLLEEC